MKKLIIGMVATIMVAAGLVAASGTSATAAPYPGSVSTSTNAVGLGPFKGVAKVYVRVIKQEQAQGKPTGKLDFTFVNRKSGESTAVTRYYGGSPKTYAFALKKGQYTVLVTFLPNASSKWKASNAKTRVKVN